MVAAGEVIDCTLSDSEGEDSDEEDAMPVQEANETGNQSSEEDDLCCPISEEVYEEKGPKQPLVLPACGHTFSRETVQSLFKLNKNKRILCPLCNTKQTVRKIDGCPPNWDTIQTILRKTEKKQKRKAPKQKPAAAKANKKPRKATAGGKPARQEAADVVAPAPAAPEAGPSDAGKGQKRKKTHSQGSSGKLSGEGGSKAKVTKKKKAKTTTASKAPALAQSPLLEKIAKAEFEERARALLGPAHKQRR